MGYDVVADQTYHFQELTTAEVQGLLSVVVKASYRLHDFAYWHTYEGPFMRCHLAIKGTLNDERESLYRYIQSEQLSIIDCEPSRFCQRPQCWERTAEYDLPEQMQGFIMFDRHGEDLHELHSLCIRHVKASSRRILKSLQIDNLTPEKKKYWTKVLSWQWRSWWYAQKVEEDQDGDYESGYYDCCYGSPYLGGFLSREEAIAAATEW